MKAFYWKCEWIEDLFVAKRGGFLVVFSTLPATYGEGAVRAVTLAVISIFALTLLLFFGLILLRFIGSRREKTIEKRKERIRTLVYELIAEEQFQDRALEMFSKNIARNDLKHLRSVLLENARVLKGKEREILSSVYDGLGFADEDLRILKRGSRLKRAEAAVRLGTMRISRATSYLIDTLSDASGELEFCCLNALSKIGTPKALNAVADYIVSASKIESIRVAEVVLEKREEFSIYVRKWIDQTAANPERLGLVIDLVGAMRDANSVPVLISLLEHSDETIRSKAAFALGIIGDYHACSSLQRLLNDASARVRAVTAEALGRLQCEDAIGALGRAIGDSSLSVKMNAAIALSRLGERGSAVLEKSLKVLDASERSIAAEVLERDEILHDERPLGGD